MTTVGNSLSFSATKPLFMGKKAVLRFASSVSQTQVTSDYFHDSTKIAMTLDANWAQSWTFNAEGTFIPCTTGSDYFYNPTDGFITQRGGKMDQITRQARLNANDDKFLVLFKNDRGQQCLVYKFIGYTEVLRPMPVFMVLQSPTAELTPLQKKLVEGYKTGQLRSALHVSNLGIQESYIRGKKETQLTQSVTRESFITKLLEVTEKPPQGIDPVLKFFEIT